MLTLLNARRHCLLALLLVTTVSCGANPKAKLWAGDQAIAQALFIAQDAELAFSASNVVPSWNTPDKDETLDGQLVRTSPHNRFSRHMATALRIGREFHQVVRVWPAQSGKQELQALIAALDGLSREIVASLPAGPNRDKLQAVLSGAQAAVLAAIPFLVE